MIKAKVKKFIKSIISKYPSYTAEGIISRIRNFDYVSFDIFDTLVKRAVSEPDDIFRIMAKKCSSDSSFPAFINEFHEVRTASEKTARNAALQAGREDTTLTEIYGCLPERYSAPLKNKLMALEIAQEKACCHANPVMRRVYQWCKENKKHIIVISDMYLPLDCVKEILSQCGYDEYDRLFLSSNVGLTKTSGNLYSYALGCMQIEARKLAHIGDNVRGDYIKAKKQGIKAVWIARDPQRTKFTRLCAMSTKERKVMKPLAQAMNGLIDVSWDEYYQYGFEVIGPLLYGFCTWLHSDAKQQGIEKLFFLARDGYLIQKAYQQLFDTDAIINKYLYASRKALHTPLFWIEPSLESILSLHQPLMQWNCKLLCKELGVNEDAGVKAWSKQGLSEEQRFSTRDMVHDPQIEAFFEAIKYDVVKNSKCECDTLLCYLEQNGFKGKVAVIDLGWNGSLLKCLSKILYSTNTDVDLWGYYLGLTAKAQKLRQAKAYIRDDYPHSSAASLIEFPFIKLEGSTKSYENTNNKIRPVIYPYEYEDRIENEYIVFIQEGALQFLKDYKDYLSIESFENDLLWSNLRLVIRQPRQKELDLFAGICVYEREFCKLAAPQSWVHYFMRPQKLISDILNSRWKIGFLKKLLRAPLPYYSFAKLLNRNTSKT